MDQALAILAAAALRGKHDLVVPHTVHHFAADEQPRRSAAAQMQHDKPAFLQRLVHDLLRAANGHGPAVEGMAQHPALQHRHTGDAGDGRHLVHRHGIVHIGGDALRLRDVQGDDRAQIRGVSRLLHAVQIVAHLLVHHERAGGTRRDLTASGAHGVQRFRRDVLLLQHLFHQRPAEVHLLHHVGKGCQLVGAVAQRLLKDAVLAVKDAHLGRGGAGIDDKDAIIHCRILLSLGLIDRSWSS